MNVSISREFYEFLLFCCRLQKLVPVGLWKPEFQDEIKHWEAVAREEKEHS